MRLLPAIKALVPKMRRVHGVLADGCALAGAALVTAGVRDIYRPAALMFAGLALLAFSFGMSRRTNDR